MLHPERTALIVVDVQERFASVITGFDVLVGQCRRLVRAFTLLELPVIPTEQYPRGLGATVEPLRVLLRDDIPSKTTFSSCGCDELGTELRAAAIRDVLVCGIETHVCVQQTVLDLLAEGGRGVHVAVDAVRSRDGRELDREVALRRMEHAGAVLTTAEAAAFELMRDAKHAQFKPVQALFK